MNLWTAYPTEAAAKELRAEAASNNLVASVNVLMSSKWGNTRGRIARTGNGTFINKFGSIEKPPSRRKNISGTMSSFRDRLLGAWTLVSYTAHSPANPSDKIHPMGPAATGIIMYTSDGHMSAQLQTTPGAPAFDPPGTDAEWADVGRRYIAYTGRFWLDEEGDDRGPVLVHEMRNSNLPRLVGDRQRRLCEIREDDGVEYLYLSVEGPMVMDGVQRVPYVVWKKMEVNRAAKPPARL